MMADEKDSGEDGSSQPLMKDASIFDPQYNHTRREQSKRRCLMPSGPALILLAIFLQNLVGLIVWLEITVENHSSHVIRCRGLKPDDLFGDIPWQDTVLENNDEFMNGDPGPFIDGKGGDNTTLWSSIYPSAWVAVSDPSRVNYGGGAELSKHSDDLGSFSEGSQAFGIAVMHQIHCLALMQSAYLSYEATGTAKSKGEHIPHCIEYLRQAVMCNADLTLEKPEDANSYPQRVTCWGNTHRCRDWGAVIAAIQARALRRGKDGWVLRFPDVGQL